MLYEEPLTKKQQDFATVHHNLVYKFMKDNHLPESEFYDVIIFGYLKAVRDYLTRKKLQNYSFSTIAWKSMTRSTSNYFRSQKRQKKHIKVLSIHTPVYRTGMTLEELLPRQDILMQQLEIRLLLHDLAGHISKQQMEIVQSKMDGYANWEIAHRQQISVVRIKELLEEVRTILMQLCYE